MPDIELTKADYASIINAIEAECSFSDDPEGHEAFWDDFEFRARDRGFSVEAVTRAVERFS